MDEELCYLGFSHFLGIGPMKFGLLLKEYGTVQKAYRAPRHELQEVIGDKTGESFAAFRDSFNAVKIALEISAKSITIVTRASSYFPEPLKNIPDPPICLYVKGAIEKYDFSGNNFFAIVGTRKPSSYGRHIAATFSRELCMNGIVIVSGLALGIDTFAHGAAVENNKRTIAFVGCGVDIVYPPGNNGLYNKIIATGGLVISEFPPGMMVKPGLFVARNRLISGLSKGVLMVEGTKESGGLITARYAAEQGREVFAPPVPITSTLSEGPNLLLKQGATLVTCIEDIFEAFNIDKKKQPIDTSRFTGSEKVIVETLSAEAMSSDDLSETTGIMMSALLPVISSLEIQGGNPKES